jgi:hypothetical protein
MGHSMIYINNIWGGNRKIFEAMTSTAPLGTIDSEASMFVANLYHGKYHWKYTLWIYLEIHTVCYCWNETQT